MTNGSSDAGVYKTVCVIAAVIAFLYGLGFLLVPQFQFQLSQDPSPVTAGWVRWAGGMLIGISVALWLAARDPAKQRPLVCGFTACYALVTLALLYSALSGEYQGVAWYIWTPIVINAVLTAAFWWLSQKYKAVL